MKNTFLTLFALSALLSCVSNKIVSSTFDYDYRHRTYTKYGLIIEPLADTCSGVVFKIQVDYTGEKESPYLHMDINERHFSYFDSTYTTELCIDPGKYIIKILLDKEFVSDTLYFKVCTKYTLVLNPGD
jgi:hypothetical protein